ncbi:MAG: hypothetical protein YHS30scaffold324_41 [Catenulispora phage 69_17]|nr:MAG: hypothetical protein YHS30scaffold324_41 [Catenulispora phage 69_17]
MKTAADIREDAIALLVEKLREIEAEADRQCKKHREAEKSPGALADFHAFRDHREAAALNYALAYRCEQLIEEITGALLFDELDAQDEAANQAAKDAEAQDDAMSTSERFEHDQADEFAQDARDEARNAAEAAESEAGR